MRERHSDGKMRKRIGRSSSPKNAMRQLRERIVRELFSRGEGGGLRESDLNLSSEESTLFPRVIQHLLEEKWLEKETRYALPKGVWTAVEGIFRSHLRGFGFVQPQNHSLCCEEIFIPKLSAGNASDGDRVKIALVHRNEKGWEGRIEEIIQRKQREVMGVVLTLEEENRGKAHVMQFAGQPQVSFVSSTRHLPLAVGDRLVLKIASSKQEKPLTVIKKLGNIEDPSTDIETAQRMFALRKNFSPEVIREARAFPTRISFKEGEGREDLRSLYSLTIDPDTAKDFDDALSLERNEEGEFLLGVHIADVSHYVTPNSTLDREARLRSNSTYFPGICLPMLPEKLSNELCSLRPRCNRMAVSLFLHFSKEGSFLDAKIFRSIIHSRARLTYREVQEILEKKRESPHSSLLNQMRELCLLLQKRKRERGVVALALPEVTVEVDKKGKPLRICQTQPDFSHQLVEEFMVEANRVVAEKLAQKGISLPYRIHPSPDEEGLRSFIHLAHLFGFSFSSSNPELREIQALFEELSDPLCQRQLSTRFIRSMKWAQYSVQNEGHYGLALPNYTHFTSPIRRYVDVIIHRLILGESSCDQKSLEKICQECSEAERKSTRAEEFVKSIKKYRLLKEIWENNPQKTYIASITLFRAVCLYFELDEWSLEGSIKFAEMSGDFFELSKNQSKIVGRESGLSYQLGSKIELRVLSVNLVEMEVKWSFIQEVKEKKEKKNSQESGKEKNGKEE